MIKPNPNAPDAPPQLRLVNASGVRADQTQAWAPAPVAQVRESTTAPTTRWPAEPADRSLLFDLAPVAYVCLDSLGRIRELNLAAATLLGGERDALRDAPLMMRLEPGDAEAFYVHVLAVLAGEGHQTLETRLRDGSGGHRDVRLVSSRHLSVANPLCLTILLDITEQRRGTERLRRADAFGKALLRALPMQAAVLDRSGMVVAVNEPWQRSAREGGEAAGLMAGIGLDYVLACRKAVRSAGDTGETGAALGGIKAVLTGARASFSLEYGYSAPEGPRWFNLTARALPEPIGGALLIRAEVTDRKVAEAAARRWEEGPAHAARVNAVGALSCALIHELSQPLATLGFSGDTALTLLRSGAATPEQVIPLLERIDAQAGRAGELVRRLRGFMRRGSLERDRVDLAAAIADAVDLVQPYASEKGVALGVTIPRGPLEVMADQIQVEQVLVNLINNGIEAIHQADSPERRVEVRLTWAADAFQVTVRDSGPGLAPERCEAIFAAFETGKPSGLGMGLAISRALIEAHGGRLWADPAATGGAAFHFTLPAVLPPLVGGG